MVQHLITYASDCSGYGCPELALNRIGLPYRYVFASDINKLARHVLGNSGNPPDTIFHDGTAVVVEARMRKSPYRSFRGCLCPPFMCALQSAHTRTRPTRPNAIDAVHRQCSIEDSVGEWLFFFEGSIVQIHLFEYEMSRGLQVFSDRNKF